MEEYPGQADPKTAVVSVSILFAIYATNVHKHKSEQTLRVVTGEERCK